MIRSLRFPLLLLTLVAVAGCGSSSTIATGPTPVKCRVSLSGAMGFEAAGGTNTLAVSTQPECTWTAAADAPWISGLTPSSGQGNGDIQFRVAANAAPTARQAAIVVNDDRVMVQQGAATCRYELSARDTAFASSGGTASVAVTTVAGCSWSATSSATWIRVSGGGGSGSGAVTLSVEPNTAGERSATVTIAGERYQVAQAAAPAAPTCTFAVTPTAQTVGAAGGGGTITVTSPAGCAWQATSSEPWIVVTSAGGNGAGSATFVVAVNPGSTFRTGTIAIGDQRVVITQDGTVPCEYEISPTSQSFPEGGGTGTAINVTAGAACTWTATSATPWITIVSGSTGSGVGTVRFAVAANTGSARTGQIIIAGRTFTATQAAATAPADPPPAVPSPPPGPTCSYALSSTAQTVAASGGLGSPVSVSTSAGCTWTAVSQTSWITVESGISGSGNGGVTFRAAANAGAQRAGTIVVAGFTVTVTQGAASSTTPPPTTPPPTTPPPTTPPPTTPPPTTPPPTTPPPTTPPPTTPPPTCTYGISPSSYSAPANGGAAPAIAVTAGSGCAWTASSNAAWLTVTSGATGTGNGSVVFTVAANSGAARSGTLTVAGQTFTVTQGADCTASLSANSFAFGAPAGAGTPVNVSIAAGCAWTASSSAPWLIITAGASGNGNGSVDFSATANTGAARSATLTIAGLTFSVSQAAAPAPSCTYSINPTSRSVSASQTNDTVTVTASAGCAWTATSNATWLTITSGTSGSGNGSVGFTAAANTGAARSGTLTVAGLTFSVSQAAAPAPPCTYGINPTSRSVSASQTNDTVTVTASAGCAWTASSNAAWLTITSGASGSGNGSVAYTIAANTGAARSGTLTIAGLTFTVSQAAAPAPACTYSINPTSRSVGRVQDNYTVTVTAGAGCAWTASSNVSWVSIIAGASGTGDGTVSFRTQRNSTGSSRSGTLTIAGLTFTINQDDDDDE